MCFHCETPSFFFIILALKEPIDPGHTDGIVVFKFTGRFDCLTRILKGISVQISCRNVSGLNKSLAHLSLEQGFYITSKALILHPVISNLCDLASAALQIHVVGFKFLPTEGDCLPHNH